MSYQDSVVNGFNNSDSSDDYSSTSSGYIQTPGISSPDDSSSEGEPVDPANLPTLSEQNEIIREIMKDKKVEAGESLYAISKKWYRVWSQAVETYSYSNDVKFPPKLNNKDIYDEDNKCLDYCKSENDYILVNKEIWDKVQEWYPGGPEIKVEVFIDRHGDPKPKTDLIRIRAIYKEKEISFYIWKKDTVKNVKKQFFEKFDIKVSPESDNADNILSDSEIEAENQAEIILNTGNDSNNESQEEKEEKIPAESDFRLLDAYSSRYVIMEDSSTIDGCNIIKDNKIILDYKVNGEWKNVVEPISNYQSSYQTSSTGYSPYAYNTASYNGYSSSAYRGYGSSSYNYNYYGEPLGPGKVGLQNIGNTCFFNSGTQCLLHTKPLVKDLLRDGWDSEINTTNPLGLKGRLAIAFQELLKKVWDGTSRVLEPSRLKSVIGQFNDIFASYGQQDAHEFLIFLLDGIHEDLNRCINKPMVDTVIGDGTNDEETAAKAWEAHKLRNDSIITDRFQAQLRSKLTCPKCHRTTVVFDPYTTLSLPISKPKSRKVKITFVPYDLTKTAEVLKIEIPSEPSYDDLDAAISKELGREVKVQGATSTYNGLTWMIEEPVSNYSRPIYFAFEILNADLIQVPCCVVINRASAQWPDYPQEKEGSPIFMVGVDPKLIVKNKDELSTAELEEYAQKAHDAIIKEVEERTKCYWTGVPETEDSNQVRELTRPNKIEHEPKDGATVEVVVESPTPYYWQNSTPAYLVREAGAVRMAKNSASIYISDSARADPSFSYAALSLNLNSGVEDSNENEEDDAPINLADCFSMFTQEETLDEQNEWFCPHCREHVCATKKMDLWSAPQILILHLKRFSGGGYSFRKDERRVNYPDELDIAPFLAGPHSSEGTRYRLYAVSEHMGGMGGGHYTAHAVVSAPSESKGEWFSFNDSSVHSASRSDAHNISAYLLFYQRIDDSCPVIEDVSRRTSSSSSSSDENTLERIPPPCGLHNNEVIGMDILSSDTLSSDDGQLGNEQLEPEKSPTNSSDDTDEIKSI